MNIAMTPQLVVTGICETEPPNCDAAHTSRPTALQARAHVAVIGAVPISVLLNARAIFRRSPQRITGAPRLAHRLALHRCRAVAFQWVGRTGRRRWGRWSTLLDGFYTQLEPDAPSAAHSSFWRRDLTLGPARQRRFFLIFSGHRAPCSGCNAPRWRCWGSAVP